jgi:hypothetical protein
MSEYIWYVRIHFMFTNASFFMYPPYTIFEAHYTVKKGYRFSRHQPGCHLPNSLAGNYLIILGHRDFGQWHPSWAGDGKIITLFLQCSAHPPLPPPSNPLPEPWAIRVSILMTYWRYSRPPINYNVLISISLLINAQGSSSQCVRTGTAKQWGRVLFCSRDLIKSQSIVCPKRGAYFNEQNSCVRRASCASPQGYVGIQHQETLLTACFRCAVILKFKFDALYQLLYKNFLRAKCQGYATLLKSIRSTETYFTCGNHPKLGNYPYI